MAHEHEHHHGESYYLDQLCTVAACGLLGGIAFLIWRTDLLTTFNILAAQFRVPVLLGGVGLLGLSVLRGVSLWSEVGRRKAVAGHDHHHHDHAHDHGHDHHHD